MLSEISQTEKEKYCIILPISGILKQIKKTKKPKFIDTKNRLEFARGREWGGWAK